MGGLFGALGISASGMAAERVRMDVIADNLANADTTRGPNGQPYQRKEVLLQATNGQTFASALSGAQLATAGAGAGAGAATGDGVQVAGIVADPTPGRKVYDPGHPDADAQGYVTMPNVSSVTEMVDLITASRSYEADTQAMQAAKTMYTRTLDLLR